MRIEAVAGPSVLTDGALATPRTMRTGELAVSEVHGRYYEQVVRQNTFTASTQAAVAMATSLTTAAAGFVLSNPAGSGVNVVVLDYVISPTAAVAGAAQFLLAAQTNPIATATVHTTPLTTRPVLIGGSGTPKALADSSATLGATPVAVRAGGNIQTNVGVSILKDEVAGALVLAPGTAIATVSLTTATTAVISMTWEEVPV